MIGAYHGTTLKPLGSALVTAKVEVAYFQSFLGDVMVHDVERGLFLVRTADNDLVFIQQDLIEKGADPVVRKIRLADSVARMSFFDHPKTGKPKLLINRGGASLSQLDLPLDPEDKTVDVDWNATATGCPNTTSGSNESRNMTPMRSGNRVYIGCSGTINGSNRMGVVRIPLVENPDGSETPGIAETFAGPFTVAGDWVDPQAERVVLLSSNFGGKSLWVFDGKASRYVGLINISNMGPGNLYKIGFGFDPAIGRFYAQRADDQGFAAGEKYKDQGGLLVVDTRLTPVPQALIFPQFASVPRFGQAIATMPPGPGVPRRVFSRRIQSVMKKYPDGEEIRMPNEMFYRVTADEIPVPEQAGLAQLDALTVPVAETTGKTEVSFDAEGSGYGIRLRSVGGVWSALRPFAQAYSGLGLELLESVTLGNRYALPACLFPDRELMAGWVPGAHLSDLDAAARSSGLEVDSNSKTDLLAPFSRCNPTANQSNLPGSVKPVLDVLWPLYQLAQFKANQAAGSGTVEFTSPTGAPAITPTNTTTTPLGALTLDKEQGVTPTVKFNGAASTGWDNYFKEVECVGDATVSNTATVGNIYGAANCLQKQGLVTATARGSAPGVGPTSSAASAAGFSVGEGYSTVTVARDQVKGVVVTSTAVAKGIEIPHLTIGYVTTTAVAWSNGRPGEKRAEFTRTICNVNPPLPTPNPQNSDPRLPNTGCLTPTQQQKMADDWNKNWGINSKMYLPTPDLDYLKGSPGGYVAGVIKPLAEEFESQLFSKDFLREVPGLVIEFRKDTTNQGFAMQSLQLAAVRAIAGLGVQCNADHIYTPQPPACVALTYEDDPVELEEEEEFEEEENAFSTDDSETDGGWTEVTAAPEGLALGRRIGNFIANLPILRQLPIRQMGEALLAASVWFLFLLPPLLASRRFALSLARKN